jgi:hypothetical protein
MPVFKRKYITHYLQLFDNTIADGRPVDRREEVDEGAVTFRRNGIVLLGEKGGFGFTREIRNVEFGGGYVANRSRRDQILVVNSPTGEVFRFRYVTRDCNWYRIVVVENAPSQYSFIPHLIREDVSDYGPIIGLARGLFRTSSMLVLNLVCGVVMLVLLCFLFCAGAAIVHEHLGQPGTEVERRLVALVWTVEGVVIGIWFLGRLAAQKGTRFYRVVLPLLFICLVVWLATSGLSRDAAGIFLDWEQSLRD